MSTTRKTQLDGLAVTLLLACCLFWGFQQVLIKATMVEIPPMFQASLRLIGATLLLWLWCLWRRVPLFGRDCSLGAGLLAGSLFASEFACIYLGLQHTSASRLTVFLYTSPFWVAVLVPRWAASEKLRGWQWAGLLCAFGAVVFALGDGFAGGSAFTVRGDVLAWMWMLGRYPATKISVFVFFTPLFALLFGALWLNEPVTPSLIAALLLVSAGLVLVNRKSPAPPPDNDAPQAAPGNITS